MLASPPPPPPPPAPPPQPAPPARASDLARDEGKAAVYLTPYEQECLRKRTAAGTVEDPNSAEVGVYYATSRQGVTPAPARDRYFGTRSEPFAGDRVSLNFGLTLEFKLMIVAKGKWRKLDGRTLLPVIIQGVEFPNGLRQRQTAA